MKIRLSTVMMTSRKKGTLSWGFHQMTLKVEVIEYPHHKIMAHASKDGGGGRGLAAPQFKWREWSKRGENQSQNKISGPKINRQNSRAEFPSLKNPHNGLNKITRKKQRKLNVCGCLFIVPFEFNFSSSGILELQDRIRARYCNVLLQQSSNCLEIFTPKTFLLKSRHPPPPPPN